MVLGSGGYRHSTAYRAFVQQRLLPHLHDPAQSVVLKSDTDEHDLKIQHTPPLDGRATHEFCGRINGGFMRLPVLLSFTPIPTSILTSPRNL
jgi:hypothetical protein